MVHSPSSKREITISPSGRDRWVVYLEGPWRMRDGLPSVEELRRHLEASPEIRRLEFDTGKLGEWDTNLLIFLIRVLRLCDERGVETDSSALPAGARQLLKLVFAGAEKKPTSAPPRRASILARIGTWFQGVVNSARCMVRFVGDCALTLAALLRGRARYRKVDLWRLIQECGADALPVVTLISVLVGVILAFVGAIQLRQFGAQIYVANLVGVGMTREMGAMMTAIVMAGRTGAAFAAELGAMTVNEEVDALETLGCSPMQFLVLPRLVALVLMMPLLCVCADFLGILGGAFVSSTMLDLSLDQYWRQTRDAVQLDDFLVGVVKSAVFGVLVALSGCLRGMQCERNSAAIGQAATSSVVTSIVFIIVCDALFSVALDILQI